MPDPDNFVDLGWAGKDGIPVVLSAGCAWFPPVDGSEMVEVGDVDQHGQPSPAEAWFGAETLRRLNG